MKTYVSYDQFHQHTILLSKKLKMFEFDYIVGPSRGGLLPGVILSHELGIPFRPLLWSTRDHSQQTHDTIVVEDLKDGYSILLVDDINDTGRTFVELIEDWEYTNDCAGTLTIASVFQRYNTKNPSNYYQVLVESDSYIVFPWEKD